MVGQSGLGCFFTGRTAVRSPSNGVTERENFINNFHFLCVEPRMILFSFVLPFRRPTEGCSRCAMFQHPAVASSLAGFLGRYILKYVRSECSGEIYVLIREKRIASCLSCRFSPLTHNTAHFCVIYEVKFPWSLMRNYFCTTSIS